MLVVRVELWDGGGPSRREYLGGAAIANVSDLADTSDYVVAILDAQHDLIHARQVRRHPRSNGWALLVSNALRPTRSRPSRAVVTLAQAMAERVRGDPPQ